MCLRRAQSPRERRASRAPDLRAPAHHPRAASASEPARLTVSSPPFGSFQKSFGSVRFFFSQVIFFYKYRGGARERASEPSVRSPACVRAYAATNRLVSAGIHPERPSTGTGTSTSAPSPLHFKQWGGGGGGERSIPSSPSHPALPPYPPPSSPAPLREGGGGGRGGEDPRTGTRTPPSPPIPPTLRPPVEGLG